MIVLGIVAFLSGILLVAAQKKGGASKIARRVDTRNGTARILQRGSSPPWILSIPQPLEDWTQGEQILRGLSSPPAFFQHPK